MRRNRYDDGRGFGISTWKEQREVDVNCCVYPLESLTHVNFKNRIQYNIIYFRQSMKIHPIVYLHTH